VFAALDHDQRTFAVNIAGEITTIIDDIQQRYL